MILLLIALAAGGTPRRRAFYERIDARGREMPIRNHPADPLIHQAATRIAERFVWVIQAILRPEERPEALREAYLAAREEIEAYERGRGAVRPDAAPGNGQKTRPSDT